MEVKIIKFREHRGGLIESMKTLVELPDRPSLVEHCQRLLAPDFVFEPSALKVEPYFTVVDTRIGWVATYVVIIKNYGVMGFTDSEC